MLAADFDLTDDALERLNQYVISRARAFAATGEEPATGLEVRFSFIPGLGRIVTAYFDGDVSGCEIST